MKLGDKLTKYVPIIMAIFAVVAAAREQYDRANYCLLFVIAMEIYRTGDGN